MIVGIIGSGGREHALCESLKKSNKITKIYLAALKHKKINWGRIS